MGRRCTTVVVFVAFVVGLLIPATVSVSNTGLPTSVIELNDKFLDVMNSGFWFVEFYAPWCGHCKRLMSTWEQVGYAVNEKNLPIRMGKLDCTRFQSVAGQLDIHGYPTLIFFRDGKRIEYYGDRTKEALLSFAIKCSSPVVENINAAKLTDIKKESRKDPSFIIIDGEKDALYEEYEKVANDYFSKVRFYSAQRESMPPNIRDSTTRIVVVRDDAIYPYQGNTEGLSNWVKSERWPVLPQATSSNIQEMGTSEKLLVLAVASELDKVNSTHPVSEFFLKFFKAAADSRKSAILKEKFQFGWLDGNEIANSIQMRIVEEPSMFVFNYSSYEFLLPEDDPLKMTSSAIITYLETLLDQLEKGSAQPLGGRSWLTRIRRMAWEVYSNIAQMFAAQPLLSTCLFGVPIAFISIICYSICSADFSVERNEFYPEDEDEEELLDEDESDSESRELENSPIDPNHQKAE
ncbi:hypothetical protein WR25_07350 [Diploscapter pachys]|uniref:Thioredoxin domain-containing protein n=1 Tax=Diploscapter pachys TaxID=2018661 RepID=A0A2A2KB89_9BILA|nr:hypothetical protein WR25_07350 [Diploscapter pachys]